jgi:hypothetical protein
VTIVGRWWCCCFLVIWVGYYWYVNMVNRDWWWILCWGFGLMEVEGGGYGVYVKELEIIGCDGGGDLRW